MLELATKGIFIYKDKFYQQIDGVTMGSPLGPTLANFFLAEIETRLLETNLNFFPKVYYQYVDDIFAVFDSKKDCSKFFDLLNKQHKNLNFTMEKSLNANSLPFLDVHIELIIATILIPGSGENLLILEFFLISRLFVR